MTFADENAGRTRFSFVQPESLKTGRAPTAEAPKARRSAAGTDGAVGCAATYVQEP